MGEDTNVWTSSVPVESWRRLSPLSPLLNSWSVLVVVFSVLFIQGLQNVGAVSGMRFLGWNTLLVAIVGGAIIFLLTGLVVAGYSWLSWQRTSYAVTDQAVWFRKGILFKTERHARLERIQAVDLIRPLLGRVFGVGKISIEVAGSAGSSLTFGYLKNDDLVRLRADIVARAAGVGRAGVADAASGSDSARGLPGSVHGPTPPPTSFSADLEQPLYRVETTRLIAALNLNMAVLAALFIAVILVVTVVVSLSRGFLGLWGLLTVVPVIFGLGSVVWARFITEYNFRAAVTPAGIRVRRGLLETRSQTIPPRRVHAIKISQPFLWRFFGWFRVVIDQAGYETTGESQSSQTSSVLLPVGSERDAILALWLVLPDLGVPDPQQFLRAALAGEGPGHGFTVNPPRSKLLDPLVFRRRGVAVTDTCMVIRDGYLTRSAVFVPYARIQSLGVRQGPLQSALQLATVAAHTVPGPVRPHISHLAEAQAEGLLELVAVHAQQHRDGEPSEEWLSRTANLGEASHREHSPGPATHDNEEG